MLTQAFCGDAYEHSVESVALARLDNQLSDGITGSVADAREREAGT